MGRKAAAAWQGPPLPPDSPCILKAVWEHASRGLDEGNIIAAPSAAAWRIACGSFTRQSGRPCFAEQFVEGREFNLSVLGGRATGPEVLPSPRSISPPSRRESPASWGIGRNGRPDSFEFHHTPRRFDFSPADEKLLARLQHLARACWRLFGLRGYARVDFRVDRAGPAVDPGNQRQSVPVARRRFCRRRGPRGHLPTRR